MEVDADVDLGSIAVMDGDADVDLTLSSAEGRRAVHKNLSACLQVREHAASACAAPELQTFAAAHPEYCHSHSHSVFGNVLDPPATASSSHLDGMDKDLTTVQSRVLWDAAECTRKWEGRKLLSPATRTDAALLAVFHLCLSEWQ